MLIEIGLESMKDIDMGIVSAQFKSLLSRAIEDCSDRPVVKTKREVSLVVRLTPECGDRGDCSSVDVGFEVKSKLPAYGIGSYVCQLRKRRIETPSGPRTEHVLAYNELSRDDVQQGTLDLDNPNDPKKEERDDA